ncbi:hypothetical protein [Gordonia sp. NB41Y]|uniref:hypothetical protein n=1 Tax=Gordonia sp. NB41Y TaxID=875808 RepID=UPI0002BE18AF|nr:hypothetical protein [Gordonia sp. NB41Y]WLP89460.1 hypothetical protein Q9K23_18015 [Gordonia sp. NB41Y]
MSGRHTVEHDYLNPHHSDLLDRFYDRWGLGDVEVARRYRGECRHARNEVSA